MHNYNYPGKELAIFERATNWKKYFRQQLLPFIGSSVLEVGGGIGGTTRLLNTGVTKEWLVIEPDANLYKQLIQKTLPNNVTFFNGTIDNITHRVFDTILYIDVLEHIKEDRHQLERAMNLLQPGGHLITLSPAFNFIYSAFDKEIGHYTRYTKKSLKEIAPTGGRLCTMRYLDSLGYLSSLANKFFLHKSHPTERQIHFWDKVLIPLSKIIDRVCLFSFGKSILAIWQKTDQ